jgi:RNA polymerase sigma-70 factor (ECF subfamily)
MRELAREIRIDEVQFGELQRVLASEEDSPSTEALAREQIEELDRALARLPEHYRQVVLMRHREGLSFEAIGQRLERSGEAVRKLWARAVEQLQEILEPPHEPQG